MEDFDAMFATDVANAAPAPEPVAAPEPEPAPLAVVEPVAPPEPAPAPAVEPLAAPAQPEVQPMAPVSALIDERLKRQDLEKQLQAYRDREAQQQRPQAPDPYEDPVAYADHQAQTMASQMMAVKLDLSEDMARGQHGDELVDKAFEWAKAQFASRPGFYQEITAQRSPYDYLVRQYQRDQIASSVTQDEFTQFQAWKAAQAQLATQQPAAVAPGITQPPAVTPPPRSQVSAPSAGGVAHVPTGPGQAFGSIFQ